MTLPRRTFLKSLGLLIAAPAIVRVASIMPVKAIRPATDEEIWALLRARMDECYRVTRENMARSLFGPGWEKLSLVEDYDGGPKFEFKQIAAELVFEK
jgi:hypothetical protein